MGARELVEKIRADGKARVGEIERERDGELGRVEQRRNEEIAKLEQEYRTRMERETRLITERARSRARLSRRNTLLEAQWKQVDKVLELTGRRLGQEKDYPELVRALVERHAGESSVVRLSPEDTGHLGPGLKAKIGEPVSIAGGMIIEQGRVTLDFSVDRVLETIRGRLATELVRALFPEDSGRRTRA